MDSIGYSDTDNYHETCPTVHKWSSILFEFENHLADKVSDTLCGPSTSDLNNGFLNVFGVGYYTIRFESAQFTASGFSIGTHSQKKLALLGKCLSALNSLHLRP